LRIQALLLFVFSLTASGCQPVYYYGQAINGQLGILINRVPIEKILDDPQTSETLKNRLSLILEIREFAEKDLHLPADKSYLSYVDLHRPYVVWNVFAAPEFSLTPKTWCYPIVGCVAYRGYFSEQDARNFAGSLKKNYDVYVGGVTAYSTLGWFDDPVLSTIMHLTETESAALIFHELTHRMLYAPDDTAFNESFATTVEQEGVRRWLAFRRNPDAFDAYLRNFRRDRQFVELIMKYRRLLEALYQAESPPSAKREQKARLFYRLKLDHDRLKKQWNGSSRYAHWFRQRLNNAQLISVLTYQDLVPAFTRLLDQKQGDLEQFYNECRALAKKSKAERYERLNSYLETH